MVRASPRGSQELLQLRRGPADFFGERGGKAASHGRWPLHVWVGRPVSVVGLLFEFGWSSAHVLLHSDRERLGTARADAAGWRFRLDGTWDYDRAIPPADTRRTR